ncbi:SDR family oxidoreductase [Streptomyces sp. SID3343]|uniref:SDR family oxidoreductase n=1 Tax=Streptomyces sp. SID3343 TaxID=2690260 RepID=UPI001367F99B|nr:SDR family oxidoreductase [Streptomyces sp. SID3343]MYW00344.1 NAD(P)H-binding protein [Streptomyces sp. SID3343]
MRIVIAGGHGKIALRLERLLAERGHTVAGFIRNPDQANELREAGAEPIECDLERAAVEEVVEHLAGADAVVFAAGAGPDSSRERTMTVDYGGAVLLADAAEDAGVRRYLIVSSMGASTNPPPDTDPDFALYLKAKGEAEEDLLARGALDLTILRPGRLTDDAGTGLVSLSQREGGGAIRRDDVAAVLAELLEEPGTAGLTLEVVGGDVPAAEAVRYAARAKTDR